MIKIIFYVIYAKKEKGFKKIKILYQKEFKLFKIFVNY